MSGFRSQPKGFATKAIHVGQDPEQWSHQSVIPPIVLSTTFKQPAPAEPIVSEPTKIYQLTSFVEIDSIPFKCIANCSTAFL